MNKLAQALYQQIEFVGSGLSTYILFPLEYIFEAIALASASSTSALTLVGDVSEGALVSLGEALDTGYTIMAQLSDMAGLLFDGATESLLFMVSALAFTVQALPRRALKSSFNASRVLRNALRKLTPVEVAFIILMLDLLLRYPVTKLWDFIWGKLFP